MLCTMFHISKSRYGAPGKRAEEMSVNRHSSAKSAYEWAPGMSKIGITVILFHMRFKFDRVKSAKLRANPKRGIGFEEALEIFARPYGQSMCSELPEQYLAVGWVGERLYTLIFEVREDHEGEFYHLVTLWKATKEERRLYEENS